MLGKLRPVGSKVPMPLRDERSPFPWEDSYQQEFMGSGTQALSAAIALSVQRKPRIESPEVIIPAYGCPDLVSAIIAQGGTPVLVDLEDDLPWMRARAVRDAVSPSTVAIVGVGFLGIPERLDLLARICRVDDLLLIEDSAQCFPPASASRPVADCVVLSFGRGKPINLMGGGALLFKNAFTHPAERLFENYPRNRSKIGMFWRLKRRIINLLLGRAGYRIVERLPLGIGETRFHELREIRRQQINEKLLAAGIKGLHSRPKVGEKYDTALGELAHFGWRLLPTDCVGKQTDVRRCFLLRYPLLAPSEECRNQAVDILNAAGIGANAFYGRILPEIPGVEEHIAPASFPAASEFAARLLTLPTHEDVNASDIAVIHGALMTLALNASRPDA